MAEQQQQQQQQQQKKIEDEQRNKMLRQQKNDRSLVPKLSFIAFPEGENRRPSDDSATTNLTSPTLLPYGNKSAPKISLSFISDDSTNNNNNDNTFGSGIFGMASSADQERRRETEETMRQMKSRSKKAIALARRKPFGSNPAPPWIGVSDMKASTAIVNIVVSENENSVNNHNTVTATTTSRQRSHIPILQMQPSSSNLLRDEDHSSFDPNARDAHRRRKRKSSAVATNGLLLPPISTARSPSISKEFTIEQQQQNILRRGIVLPWIHRQDEKREKEKQDMNLKYGK